MTARKVLFLGALVALGLLGGGVTAQAAERQCVGVIGPETIRGDLVVPAGTDCELDGTRVRGSVYVRENASLFAFGADVRGSIKGDSGAFVDLLGSTLDGNLELRNSLGAFVDESSIDGSVASSGTDFVDLVFTSVAGNVKADDGGTTDLFGEALEVGGTLEVNGVAFFDLFDSTVNGNFSVRGTTQGSIFCGNTLNGNPEFTGNAGLLALGSDVAGCAGNNVNGSMKVAGNTAETEIVGNEIDGNLTCFNNAPAPVGGANDVHGNKEGQCAAL